MHLNGSTYNTLGEANFEGLTAVFVVQKLVLSMVGLTSERGYSL